MLKPNSPEWREISWERALAAGTVKVASALEKALAGKDLCLEEGLTLATVEGNDLLALVKVADELRRRVVGDRITYVVNRNSRTSVSLVALFADSAEGRIHRTPIFTRPMPCSPSPLRRLNVAQPKCASKADSPRISTDITT